MGDISDGALAFYLVGGILVYYFLFKGAKKLLKK